MGRGDVKTKRGKRWHGSNGNSRPKPQSTKAVAKPVVAPAVAA